MKRLLAVFLLLVFQTTSAQAGVPLNNLEGVGGIAFNPLAYLADASKDIGETGPLKLGYPRVGVWYVNLNDVHVDWTSIGVADTVFDRVEVSYGYETIAQSGAQTKHKHDLGAKILVIPENLNGTNYIPAVSVGGIWKKTANVAPDTDDSGLDGYLVATKLIKAFPRPLLLSTGVLTTKAKVTGVFGYDKDRDETFFGNADLLLTDWLALGVEYKQGARFKDFKNADYWELHAAWLVNKDVTLVAAYVNAGDETSTETTGLGGGFVFSLQYAF
jgi:hypothetical protein